MDESGGSGGVGCSGGLALGGGDLWGVRVKAGRRCCAARAYLACMGGWVGGWVGGWLWVGLGDVDGDGVRAR